MSAQQPPSPAHLRAGVTELALALARTSTTACDIEALLRQLCIELNTLCQLPGCAVTIFDGATRSVRTLVGSHPEAEQLTRLVQQFGANAESPSVGPGHTVQADDLTEAGTALAEVAGRVGLPVTAAIPLHGPTELVGRLRLFGAQPSALRPELLEELTPLADTLGIALYDAEAYRHSATMVTRLSEAWDLQLPIEQAKGLLAQRHQIDLDAAFRMLREQARRRELTVRAVAAEVLAPANGEQTGQPWPAAGLTRPGPPEDFPTPEFPSQDRPVPEQTTGELSDPSPTSPLPLPEQRGGADQPDTERHTAG